MKIKVKALREIMRAAMEAAIVHSQDYGSETLEDILQIIHFTWKMKGEEEIEIL